MSAPSIGLYAIDLQRWEMDTGRLVLDVFAVVNDDPRQVVIELALAKPEATTAAFLDALRDALDSDGPVDHDAAVHQRLTAWFKRVESELGNPRKRRGESRRFTGTHLELFADSRDLARLDTHRKFWAVFAKGRYFYLQEDYRSAEGPLTEALQHREDVGIVYKWLARCLKKQRRYDEAMRTYVRYAEVTDNLDAWLDLAKSYRKGKQFEKSETLYHQILERWPGDKEARIGLAQIYFARNEDRYTEVLDGLHEDDPAWLREWLLEEFNFRLYVPDKTLMPAVQAAKFLGFRQINELTQRAFRNDLPSHFNPSRGRLSFYREELENWANTMARFDILDEAVTLDPDRLDAPFEPEETFVGEPEVVSAGAGERPTTRVEEILAQIRARKAARQQNGNGNGNGNGDSHGGHRHHRSRSGKTASSDRKGEK